MIENFEQHQPQLDPTAFVHAAAFVSGQTTLGAQCSVWPMAVLRGDVNFIHIGVRSNVQDGAVLHTSHEGEYSRKGGEPLTIGDDVTVGHNAILHGCTVGNRCLIGMGAVILDGAILEDETMIGAGALVPPNKTLEGGFLWVGSPVKKARPLKAEEREFLRYSADHYVKLAQRTQASMGNAVASKS